MGGMMGGWWGAGGPAVGMVLEEDWDPRLLFPRIPKVQLRAGGEALVFTQSFFGAPTTPYIKLSKSSGESIRICSSVLQKVAEGVDDPGYHQVGSADWWRLTAAMGSHYKDSMSREWGRGRREMYLAQAFDRRGPEFRLPSFFLGLDEIPNNQEALPLHVLEEIRHQRGDWGPGEEVLD